jgi:hypothetical protein
MAKINDTSRYTYDSPSEDDYLVGTDGDANTRKTRNYRIKDVMALFPASGVNQNNTVNYKRFGPIDIATNVADSVNAMQQFEVTETENVIFTCSKYFPRSGDGVQRIPGTPVDTDIYFYTYLFRLGKGFYGISVDTPTTPVALNDFIEIERVIATVASSTDQDPIIFTIPNATGLDKLNAINAGGTYVISSGKDVYFNVANVDGLGKNIIYRFVGVAGTYGVGGLQVLEADLITWHDSNTTSSATTNIKIVDVLPMSLGAGQTKSGLINAMTPFTVSQNELYIFNFRTALVIGGRSYIFASSWFLKRGKGTYGATINDTNVLRDSDLKLNFKEIVAASETTDDLVYYNLDAIDENNIVDAINVSPTAIVIDGVNFNVIEKDGVSYKFIGADGSYGEGLTQAVLADLEEIGDAANLISSDEDVIIASLMNRDNTFLQTNIFEKAVTIEDILILPPRTLPLAPVNGTIANVGNTVLFYNGTSWYTLDMTIYGI